MPSKKKKPKLKIISTTKAGPSLERLRVGAPSDTPLESKVTALTRGTDALVTRIVNSAREQSRDLGDHILDLAKVYFQEEGSDCQHSVQCDRCKLKSPGASSERKAIKVAEAVGWIVTDQYDHCPVCKDGSKLLKAGGAALATPPKLSHAEMILVTRLSYLGKAIGEGYSVSALLQNSVRSQHRSMLSDLALETSYEIQPLLDRVRDLVAKNADVDPIFTVADHAKASWGFVGEL